MNKAPQQPSIILYQTEDGRTRIQCRFEDDTLWLTQAQIAELFQVTPQNITLHLKAIYEEDEIEEAATCKDCLQVRSEGGREVSRQLRHYSLPAILAVGYRVRSHRGTQFRQWATARLSEYLVKGFAMDDERLKNPPGPGQTDYFDELLERIRDIRASERRFYQKVLDIYATSVDYAPSVEMSQRFFATVQNKMHWAAHGHTAAEIVHQRADARKPLMGVTTPQTVDPAKGFCRRTDRRGGGRRMSAPLAALSFPTRASRAIGNPKSRPRSWRLLWIPGQAFGPPGMTREGAGHRSKVLSVTAWMAGTRPAMTAERAGPGQGRAA